MDLIADFNNIELEHSFNMTATEINIIKKGIKKSEIKPYYLPLTNKEIGIVNIDTNKIELIVKINLILDLKDLHEEELDMILSEAGITPEERKYYPCNYLYAYNEFRIIQWKL